MTAGGTSDLTDLLPANLARSRTEAAVDLSTNESPYAPPDAFMDRLRERLQALKLNRYPASDLRDARDALASHLSTLSERIWVANGSNEIFLQLLLAFGGSERKALTFEPTYSVHSHVTRLTGTRHLRGRRNPDFSIHLEASLEAIRVQQPDVVFLCSPNNPTGNMNSEDELMAVCEAAPGIVILDEAYAEFSGRSHARLVEDMERLVVTRSFSKAWRLAGARIGYAVAQPWIWEKVSEARLPYHLSAISQAVVVTAVEHSQEILSTVETIRHERDRLWGELSTTKGVTAYPSEANFVFFRCETHPADQVWQRLLDKGVLIRDFSDRPGCEDALRVSVGTPEEDERFLESLWQSLRDVSNA